MRKCLKQKPTAKVTISKSVSTTPASALPIWDMWEMLKQNHTSKEQLVMQEHDSKVGVKAKSFAQSKDTIPPKEKLKDPAAKLKQPTVPTFKPFIKLLGQK